MKKYSYKIIEVHYPGMNHSVYKIRVKTKIFWGIIPYSYSITEWSIYSSEERIKFFNSPESAHKFMETYKEQ